MPPSKKKDKKKMYPGLSQQQIAAANDFMRPRFIGDGAFMASGQFQFSKDGNNIILTDTTTNESLNLGPEE